LPEIRAHPAPAGGLFEAKPFISKNFKISEWRTKKRTGLDRIEKSHTVGLFDAAAGTPPRIPDPFH